MYISSCPLLILDNNLSVLWLRGFRGHIESFHHFLSSVDLYDYWDLPALYLLSQSGLCLFIYIPAIVGKINNSNICKSGICRLMLWPIHMMDVITTHTHTETISRNSVEVTPCDEQCCCFDLRSAHGMQIIASIMGAPYHMPSIWYTVTESSREAHFSQPIRVKPHGSRTKRRPVYHNISRSTLVSEVFGWRLGVYQCI